MALSFSGTGQYITFPSAIVPATPFSLSCWFNLNVLNAAGNTLQSISNNSSNNSNYISVVVAGPPPKVRAQVTGGGINHSSVNGAPVAGTWFHAVAVFAGDLSRTIYVNGIGSGPDTVSVTGTGLSITAIGAHFGGTATAVNLINGSIAFAAIHNIALTASDASAMYNNGAGADPSTIQSANCVSMLYMASGATLVDAKSPTPWVAVGAPAFVADPFVLSPVAPISGLSDPQQAVIPVFGYSYYLQPWKSYLDTWPGSRLLDGIGINFRPGTGNESACAQALADAGVTHARIEMPWGNFDYNNPTQMVPAKIIGYTTTINALKVAGIRPLILLNANVGAPCPTTTLVLNPTAASAIGATTITVASTAGVILGKTGLPGQKSSYQGYPLITSISGLVCTLSAPLNVAVASGVLLTCRTYLYHPLSTNGLEGPFSAETKTGWAQYVTGICNFVSSVLGSNNFDLEVWNELASDSAFLDSKNWYNPIETGTVAMSYNSSTYPGYTQSQAVTNTNGYEVIASITVDAAHSFTGVRIVNGLANQRPQDCAFNTPPGMDAFSRHYYQEMSEFTVMNDGNSGISSPSNPIPRFVTVAPINAVFGYDGIPAQTNTPPAVPNSAVNAGSYFIPNFVLSCPESRIGFATYYQYMCIELQPFASLRVDGGVGTIWRGAHWRGGVNPTSGQTVAVWETETNSDKHQWITDIVSASGVPITNQRVIDAAMFMGAKCLLRTYIFHIHKGVQHVFVFADRNGVGDLSLSIVPEAFFTVLAGNGGVLDNAARLAVGPQVTTIGRLTTFIKPYIQPEAFVVTPVGVPTITSPNAPVKEWIGDGTSAHPDMNHIDEFGVFPFQLNASAYAILYYVVTKDVARNWNIVPADVLNTSNYVMPNETYDVTLTGIANSLTVQVTCYDPFTDTYPAVTVLSQASGTMVVRVSATDYPRVLLIGTNFWAKRNHQS